MVFEQHTGMVVSSNVFSVTARRANSSLVRVSSDVVATDDHLFYAQNFGWTSAGDLATGSALASSPHALQLESINRTAVLPNHATYLTKADFEHSTSENDSNGSDAAASNGADAGAQDLVVYNVYATTQHTYFVGREGLLVHSCLGLFNHPNRNLVLDATTNSNPDIILFDSHTPVVSTIRHQTPASSASPVNAIPTTMARPAMLQFSPWTDLVDLLANSRYALILDHTKRQLAILRIADFASTAASNEHLGLSIAGLPGATISDDASVPFAASCSPSTTTSAFCSSVLVSFFARGIVQEFAVVGDSHQGLGLEFVVEHAVDVGSRNHSGFGRSTLCGPENAFLCVPELGFGCETPHCLSTFFQRAYLHILRRDGERVPTTVVHELELQNPTTVHTVGRFTVVAGTGVQRLVIGVDGTLKQANPVHWLSFQAHRVVQVSSRPAGQSGTPLLIFLGMVTDEVALYDVEEDLLLGIYKITGGPGQMPSFQQVHSSGPHRQRRLAPYEAIRPASVQAATIADVRQVPLELARQRRDTELAFLDDKRNTVIVARLQGVGDTRPQLVTDFEYRVAGLSHVQRLAFLLP